MAEPEGEVNGGDLANAGSKLNQYYQQKCTWILDSAIDRQLIIEVKSAQSSKQFFSFSNYIQSLFANFFYFFYNFFYNKFYPVTLFSYLLLTSPKYLEYICNISYIII